VTDEKETKKEPTAKPKIVSDIIPFDFHGNQVRTMIDSEGHPWFVAVDVCAILDLDNSTNALKPLDEDEKNVLKSLKGQKTNKGGAQKYNIVSFPGVNRLVMKSYKPEAKPFQRWVAHEVLMQIYKTGKYIPEGQATTDFNTVSNEFNATTAYLLSKDYTSTSALQLADSAINKLYNVNYLESITQHNPSLQALTTTYNGRLLTTQEIGDEVDMHWKKVQGLMLSHKLVDYTDKGEMLPTPKVEPHVVFYNQLLTHQKNNIKKAQLFWWKESIIDVVESLMDQPKETLQDQNGLEWWKFDYLLTPTEIGKAMTIQVEKINTLLFKLDYQQKDTITGRFVPTIKGKPFTQKTDKGLWYWKNTILPELSEILHTKHPGGWGEPMLVEYYRKAPKFHEATPPKTK